MGWRRKAISRRSRRCISPIQSSPGSTRSAPLVLRATGAASQAYASMNWPETNVAFKAAPRAAPEMPFSVYLAETYGNGSRGDRLGDAGNAIGFRYNLHGGTIGADYKFNPNLRVGAAFSYTNPNVALNGGTGNIHLNSYQAGGFVSLDLSESLRRFRRDLRPPCLRHRQARRDRHDQGPHQRRYVYPRRQVGLSVRCGHRQGRSARQACSTAIPASIPIPRPAIPLSPSQ